MLLRSDIWYYAYCVSSPIHVRIGLWELSRSHHANLYVCNSCRRMSDGFETRFLPYLVIVTADCLWRRDSWKLFQPDYLFLWSESPKSRQAIVAVLFVFWVPGSRFTVGANFCSKLWDWAMTVLPPILSLEKCPWSIGKLKAGLANQNFRFHTQTS